MTKRRVAPGATSPPTKVPVVRGRLAGAGDTAAPLPGVRDVLDWRGPFLVPLLLLLLARLLAWRELPFASEDAYITFRYARHLAHGFGLVYNPGERVFGFSSAPWTMWIALGIALVRDPLLWARVTTILADALTLLVVGRMIEREGGDDGSPARTAAWCFTSFFAAWPYFSAVAASGMESSAMIALVALTAALARRGNLATGPLLALVGLWRPEGLAAAAVLALGAPPRARLIAAALVALGLAGLAAYFGSPVPQSLLAKAGVYGTPGPWAGRFWWGWAVPLHLPGLISSGEGRLLALLSVLVAPAALAGITALWRRRHGALAPAVAAGLVVWMGYALLGVAYFYWYLALPLFAVVVLAAVGLPRIVRGRAVYASLALLVVTVWSEAYVLYVARAENEYFGFAAVATWLREHARPGESVMLEPIGMVGWSDPLRIVDEVGLVTPQVAARRLEGPGWYTDVATRERPDWIVIRRGVLTSAVAYAGTGAPFRSAAERDTLFSGYVRRTVVDEASAGDAALVILQRAR